MAEGKEQKLEYEDGRWKKHKVDELQKIEDEPLEGKADEDKRQGKQKFDLQLQLPTEIVLNEIFCRLSFLDILRLRLVSKEWSAHLSSSPFLKAWSERIASMNLENWFVVGDVTRDETDMPRDPQFFAFCPKSTQTWLNLPLHSPGPRLSARPLYPHFMSYAINAHSDGGLVCAIGRDMSYREGKDEDEDDQEEEEEEGVEDWVYMKCRYAIVVFNPLTGQTRALPTPPKATLASHAFQNADPSPLYLTLRASTLYYHVVLSIDYLSGMCIFNSQTNLWSTVAATSSLSVVRPQLSLSAQNDAILQADFFQWDAQNSLILGYSLSSGTWFSIAGPSPMDLLPTSCVRPLISVHKGQLLFVEPLSSDSQTVGFAVWEFSNMHNTQNGSFEWVFVAITPQHLRLPIGGAEGDIEEVESISAIVRSGSVIYLTMMDFTDLLYDYGLDNYIFSLTFDLDNGSWSRLPTCPGSDVFVTGFPFQPSFTAVP